ncbi:MAG TPA: hypothetical protein VGK73_24690 [Polyangiaceae bacterium]
MSGTSCFARTPRACTPREPANVWGRALASPARPRSKRRALRNAWVLALCAPCVALASLPAWAEPGPDGSGSSTSGTAPSSQSAANIVLVGDLGEDEELVLLLRELLEQQGVAAQVTKAKTFDPGALFADLDGARDIRVFVTLREFDDARLYFRGPLGDRYLLRRLTLARGLDAVGRELLGQVVESSVAALLHSSEGLSREQATRAIAREADASEAPRVAAGARPTEPPPAPKKTEREFHAAVRYALSWSGTEVGLAHGPGIVLGLRYRARPGFGFELAFERFFPQSLTTDALDADVQKTSFRALCELGLPFAEVHWVAFGFGPALELSRLRPLTAEAGVTLAPPSTDVAPALRLELRYFFSAGPAQLGAAAQLDIGLVKTHYDLAEASGRRELAAPALLRPGAAVSIGIR